MSKRPHIPEPADEENGGGWETIGAAVVLSVTLCAVAFGIVHILLMAIR